MEAEKIFSSRTCLHFQIHVKLLQTKVLCQKLWLPLLLLDSVTLLLACQIGNLTSMQAAPSLLSLFCSCFFWLLHTFLSFLHPICLGPGLLSYCVSDHLFESTVTGFPHPPDSLILHAHTDARTHTPGLEGRASPSASRPANTPVTMDATAAIVHTTMVLPLFNPFVCNHAHVYSVRV
eukprot:1138177-Pelagomonas_calceolata.AAC.2